MKLHNEPQQQSEYDQVNGMLPEKFEREGCRIQLNQFSSAILRGHGQSNESGDNGADTPTASMSDMQVPNFPFKTVLISIFGTKNLSPELLVSQQGTFRSKCGP